MHACVIFAGIAMNGSESICSTSGFADLRRHEYPDLLSRETPAMDCSGIAAVRDGRAAYDNAGYVHDRGGVRLSMKVGIE